MATFNDPVLLCTCDTADVSGSTITDRGSGGNTLTLVGSPSIVTGHINQAVSLNGSTQYIDAGNGTDVQITGNMTVASWVYINSTGSYQFISKDGDTGGRAFAFDCVSNDLRFYINGGSSNNLVDTGVTITNSTWTHIAATYSTNGTHGTITVYINGSSVGSGSSADPSMPTATADLDFGRRVYAGFNGYLNGKMDDVRVYNRALTATDIAALFAYTGSSKLLEARRKAVA